MKSALGHTLVAAGLILALLSLAGCTPAPVADAHCTLSQLEQAQLQAWRYAKIMKPWLRGERRAIYERAVARNCGAKS